MPNLLPDEDPMTDDIDNGAPPFLRTRRSEPESNPPGTHWRCRVEWSPNAASGLTEIAEEKLTSGGPNARRVEGMGALLQLTEREVVWLHGALGELVEHRMSEPLRPCGHFLIETDAGTIASTSHVGAEALRIGSQKGRACGKPSRRHFEHHPALGCCEACFLRCLVSMARAAQDDIDNDQILAIAERRYPRIAP